VALLDGRAPATEGLDAEAAAGDTQPWCGVIALAVAQKPRLLGQRSGLRLLGGDPVLPPGRGTGHAPFAHPGHRRSSGLLPVRPAAGGNGIQGENHIHGMRWGNQIQKKTRSTRLRRGGEPDPAL